VNHLLRGIAAAGFGIQIGIGNLGSRDLLGYCNCGWGLGVSGGWLGANLYMRSQPGNLAAAPDDYGMAVRWSVGW